VYVKREGDPDFSEVLVPMEGDVCDLTELIKAELQIQEPATQIVLRRADRTLLCSTMTLAEADVVHGQHIIVEVITSKAKESKGERPRTASFL
jgi:hypothetical protein